MKIILFTHKIAFSSHLVLLMATFCYLLTNEIPQKRLHCIIATNNMAYLRLINKIRLLHIL